MKQFLIIISILLISSAFVFQYEIDEFKPFPHESINKGEQLDYRIHYGIFTVGNAKVKVYPELYRVNDRSCYKVDVYGETVGTVKWFAKVDDNWGGFVDSKALLPHMSWRNIKEGKYRKNEIVNFDHKDKSIEVKTINNKTGKFKEPKYYKAPNNVKDLVGGFLYLRAIDYSKYKLKDTIKMNAFFEDTVYNFRILYMGKDKVKTKAGTFKALKLVPVMPDNKIFAGENSVTLWLSDDENKIPIKAEANMFIGKAGVELNGFKNVKHEPSLVNR